APKKESSVELARLVQVLENDVGFEPVTEVALALRGKFRRLNGKLSFEVSGTGQSFPVAKVVGERPPEDQNLVVGAVLTNPHVPSAIAVHEWKVAAATANDSAQHAPQATRTSIAEFS